MEPTEPPFSPSLRDWRIVPRLVAMFVWLLICVPAYYLVQPFTRHNPVPQRFLGGIARIAGVRMQITGNPPQGRAVLLANHLSWLDICVLAGLTGSAFVAHDGLAGNGFMKWLCDMNNTVFIERARRTTVAKQVDQVRAAFAHSRVLALFPEGTTDDGTALLPIKSSLMAAIDPPPEGVAICPVALDYGPDAPRIAWREKEPGIDNFLKILARRTPIACTAHFLPRLEGKDRAGRKAMAVALEAALTETLALPKARALA